MTQAYTNGKTAALIAWCENMRPTEAEVLAWTEAQPIEDQSDFVAGIRDWTALLWTRKSIRRPRRSLARQGARGRRGARSVTPREAANVKRRNLAHP